MTRAATISTMCSTSYRYANSIIQGSNLVRLIRNERKKTERRVVYKTDSAKVYPKAKEFLFELSRDNPRVLSQYKKQLERLEATDRTSDVDSEDETAIAEMLAKALRETKHGDKHASAYHKLMLGVVEFLFFPKLAHPKKEEKIHEGRKRIDIVVENAARTGIFFTIPTVRKFPCAYVPFNAKTTVAKLAIPS